VSRGRKASMRQLELPLVWEGGSREAPLYPD
jgi:hypothetical protein